MFHVAISLSQTNDIHFYKYKWGPMPYKYNNSKATRLKWDSFDLLMYLKFNQAQSNTTVLSAH